MPSISAPTFGCSASRDIPIGEVQLAILVVGQVVIADAVSKLLNPCMILQRFNADLVRIAVVPVVTATSALLSPCSS